MTVSSRRVLGKPTSERMLSSAVVLAVLLGWDAHDGRASVPVAVLGWDPARQQRVLFWMPLPAPGTDDWWRARLAEVGDDQLAECLEAWQDQFGAADIAVFEPDARDLRDQVVDLVDELLAAGL